LKSVSGAVAYIPLLEYTLSECTKSCTHSSGFVKSDDGYMVEKSLSTAFMPAFIAIPCIHPIVKH
jgi:hypothetical protein